MPNRLLRSAMILSMVAGMVLGLGQGPAQAAPTTAAADGSASLQAKVNALHPGWNMGNTFDSFGCGPDRDNENCWGNPKVTREFLKVLKQQGYRSLRLPVTWFEHQGAAPDYLIEPDYLARVQEVVKWALAENFTVILNMHHDTPGYLLKMPTNHDAVLAQYKATWRQLAPAFRSTSHKLFLESINEPRFSDDWGLDTPEFFTYLNELNTSFVEIVRGSGGRNATRPLLLATLTGSVSQPRMDQLYDTIAALKDPNIIATVHYYGFFSFSINRDNYTTLEGKPGQQPSTKGDIIDSFDRVHDTFVAKGIPVIVGEWGLLATDSHADALQHGEWLKYIEFLGYYARLKSLPLMIWDNNSYFDRVTYTWKDPELFAMMRASWKTRSSTSVSDLINIVRGSAIKDHTVQLNLNGNTFKSLTLGQRVLKRDRDYTLTGSDLTISAAILSEITQNQRLGLNAKLTARFSRGADWTIKVVVYEPAVLSPTTGTTAAFSIPVQFNGDTVRTMAAAYPDGTYPAPDDWTPYKQYGSVFDPDEPTRTIKLQTNLLGALREGPVVLAFTFDSGTTVTYTLTRTGDQITGTPGGELPAAS